MTPHTAADFAEQHGRDLARIQSLTDQLAAANGRAARAEHTVIELTERCAMLRAMLPEGKRHG
jgi:hypothetical protein